MKSQRAIINTTVIGSQCVNYWCLVMPDGKVNPGRHLRTGYMDLSLGCLERKWAKKTGWSENGLFVKKGHLRRAVTNTVATLILG